MQYNNEKGIVNLSAQSSISTRVQKIEFVLLKWKLPVQDYKLN